MIKNEMINEKDVQILLASEGKKWFHGPWVLVLGLVPILIMAIGTFHDAHSRAIEMDKTLWDLASSWLAGSKPGVDYPGAYLRALEKVRMGFLLLYVALIQGIALWGFHKQRKHQQRVLATLKAYESMYRNKNAKSPLVNPTAS